MNKNEKEVQALELFAGIASALAVAKFRQRLQAAMALREKAQRDGLPAVAGLLVSGTQDGAQ